MVSGLRIFCEISARLAEICGPASRWVVHEKKINPLGFPKPLNVSLGFQSTKKVEKH